MVKVFYLILSAHLFGIWLALLTVYFEISHLLLFKCVCFNLYLNSIFDYYPCMILKLKVLLFQHDLSFLSSR